MSGMRGCPVVLYRVAGDECVGEHVAGVGLGSGGDRRDVERLAAGEGEALPLLDVPVRGARVRWDLKGPFHTREDRSLSSLALNAEYFAGIPPTWIHHQARSSSRYPSSSAVISGLKFLAFAPVIFAVLPRSSIRCSSSRRFSRSSIGGRSKYGCSPSSVIRGLHLKEPPRVAGSGELKRPPIRFSSGGGRTVLVGQGALRLS